MVVRAVFIFLLTMLLFSACEERVEVALPAKNTNLLAVEGMVTNENKNHLVRLSLPYQEQNGIAAPATGASVFLFEDTTRFTLVEAPPSSGNYYTPMLRAFTGKQYRLYILWEGRAYGAQDSPQPVQAMEELSYYETTAGFTLINREVPGADPGYIDHVVTWNNTAACGPGAPCSGRVIFYDLKTADVNEIFKPAQEVFYFPRNSRVVRRKYSVSPAYRAFLRSMLSETQWRGGVFDVERSNVYTNLSHGAVGFFAACSVVTDTTLVE